MMWVVQALALNLALVSHHDCSTLRLQAHDVCLIAHDGEPKLYPGGRPIIQQQCSSFKESQRFDIISNYFVVGCLANMYCAPRRQDIVSWYGSNMKCITCLHFSVTGSAVQNDGL